MQTSWHKSTCPHDCPSACSLQVEKLSSTRIGKVKGSKANPYTDGIICAKVSQYAQRTHHPLRILEPMVRVSSKSESAKFKKIDWDTAMDLLVEKLKRAENDYGAESIWPYYYGGTMGLIQQYGINRLTNAMGYSAMKRTFCVQIAYDGWTAGTGARLGSDPRELADSELIVLWGCNAASTQVNVMHHVSKARKKGAKLVVVDPYQTATAKIADLHIAPRPGTDGALACAVMHLLFKNEWIDNNYLDHYTDDPIRLKDHVADKDENWAAEICGVDPEVIVEFARLYGNTKASYIRLGIGFSRHRNGAVNVHAVSCLPAITGAWQYRGGGALLSTGDSFHLDQTLIQGLDLPNKSARILDMSQIGSVLCSDKSALKNDPPVKAMLIQNTNPMLVAPDLARVREGLKRDDLFTCVHEQFMTETAELADLILPATTFVEHSDLYTSYGQTFLQVAEKIIEPVGMARSNHRLICDLAARLGAEHSGFKLNEEQIIEQTLSASGYPQQENFTDQHFHDCTPDFKEAHFLNGFKWPDGKFRFSPNWQELGPLGSAMPDLPDHWDVIDNPSKKHPLKLVAAPSRGFLNSSFNQTPSSLRREKKPQLKIHANTAARFALEDQQLATIGNELGKVTATIKIQENIQPDTIVLEGIWSANAFPEKIGANVLISAQPAAPNGGAVFHDTAVWIRPA